MNFESWYFWTPLLLISFLKIADSTDTNGIVNTIFGVTRSSSSVAAGLKNDDTNLSQVEGLVNLTRKQFADDENLGTFNFLPVLLGL